MSKKTEEIEGEINHIELSDADVEGIQNQLEDRIAAEAEIEVKVLEKEADREFEAELAALMQEDNSGKKKKKKKTKDNQGRKKWSRKRKIITVGAACILVLFVVSKVFGGSKVSPQMVTTMPMTKSDIVQKLSLNGPVSGTDSVDVVSNLHAEILEIAVKEGDKVTKGQLLATLDSKDIKKKVEIAQNAYDLAVSTHHEKGIEAQNGYAKAVQDYQAAKGNYDRTNALFQSGSVSQVELETAHNAMSDMKRIMSTYTIKDGKAVADESYALEVKSKEFELEQSQTNLENTRIKSAIDGTVVRVNTKVGRFADKVEDTKPSLFSIENLEVLEMKINVSEYSIGKVALGQDVTISADILSGQSINGEVVAISPTGEEKGSGSTERVIPITIRILDQSTKLIAGITAKAEIILEESKDTWAVPISALITKEDGIYVAAVENGLIKMIGVDTRVESDIQIEIIPKEGFTLDENTMIAVNPNMGFTDGMAVVVMPAAQ